MLLINLAVLSIPVAALAGSSIHGSMPNHARVASTVANATEKRAGDMDFLAADIAKARRTMRTVRRDGNGACKQKHSHHHSASASASGSSAPAWSFAASSVVASAAVSDSVALSSSVYVDPTTTSTSSSDTDAAPTTTSALAIVEAAVVTTATHTKSKAHAAMTTSTLLAPTTTSQTWAAATTTASSSSGSNTGSLLAVTEGSCGYSDPTSTTSNTAGPNGASSWLTCGINNGGWSPPFVHVSELIAADLKTVMASGNNPFAACSAYVDKMYQYGTQYGIPPIMIASFAMQESTCNPSAVGGGGEQGMFQISKDKCGGAPNGNCQDIDFNMSTAMAYFSSTLSSLGGDVLQSIGTYNGWFTGMTYSDATAAASTSCCRCQNNLDYLHQFVNGWMQGLDGNNYGTYWNLKQCS